MPYVCRNAEGHVSGLFAELQPGFATEFLAADDPEVLFFQSAAGQEQLIYDSMTLNEYKLYHATNLNKQIIAYADSRYDLKQQQLFTQLLIGALPNRAAYINAVWTWMQAVLAYYYTLEDAITAAADKAAVAAVVVDQAQLDVFTADDPLHTVREALAIPD